MTEGVRYAEHEVSLEHGDGDVGQSAATNYKLYGKVGGAIAYKVSKASFIVNKRLTQVLTATNVDAQNNTLSVAQIVGGIVVHTSVTGGGTVTTDTAANIIAGSSGLGALTEDGQCIEVVYINDGDQTLTFAGGSNVTVADTGQTIATNEAAFLIFQRTSATTVTMYMVGA